MYHNSNNDSMFKINNLKSTLCNNCGHTTKMMYELTGLYF